MQGAYVCENTPMKTFQSSLKPVHGEGHAGQDQDTRTGQEYAEDETCGATIACEK